jgi:hypothetical protein
MRKDWHLNYNGIRNPPAGKPYTNKRSPFDYFKTNILVDTMGFNAIGVRAAIELRCGPSGFQVPYGIKEHVQIVEDVLPNPAEREPDILQTASKVSQSQYCRPNDSQNPTSAGRQGK